MGASLISIVIPVYNSEPYLNECFKSLQNQTNNNFEVIIIDDGSTDSSGEMCDNFANLKENVIVFHQENKGSLQARKKGIKLASGEYITFLDSDDCLRNDAIETLEKNIEKFSPDIISFKFCRGDNECYNKGNLGIKMDYLSAGFYSDEKYQKVLRAICSGYFNNLATKVFKSSVLSSCDDLLEISIDQGEDLCDLLPAVDCAKNYLELDEVLYFYRENQSSASSVYKPKRLDDLALLFNKLFLYAKKWGVQCESEFYLHVCRHLFWCISDLAVSSLPLKEKESETKRIKNLLISYPAGQISKAISDLRLDMKIPLRLLLKGKDRACLFFAKMIAKMYQLKS